MAALRSLSRALFSSLPPVFRRTIASIEQNNLLVQIDDTFEKFPIVWLRDNCMCEKCFHKASQSRILNWNDFDVHTRVERLQEDENKAITIKWNDAHESTYTLDWLSRRSFNANKQQNYLYETYKPKKSLWNKETFSEIRKPFQFDDVMNSDEALLKWIKHLAIHGVVFIEGAPKDATVGQKFLNKLAFIRKTHYGEEFHVQHKPNTNNVAYLNHTLQQHVDSPYYEYIPGINLLHCFVQTLFEGGYNTLTDVHYVADILKREHKEAYQTLTQTHVNWFDIGCEDGISFHKIHRAPMINLDKFGEIQAIRHSIPQRDSFFTVPLEEVEPWYMALRLFVDLSNEHAAQFKMNEGNLLTFDNQRIVHGRKAYEDSPGIQRHIIGQYIDWDEVYCKMRVLQGKLKQ